MGASEFVTPFLGALQASLSVLLTISYGVVAAQFKLLSEAAAKDISTTCVRLFLPALLITNVGSQLSVEALPRFVPVLVWSIVYNVLSMGLGLALTKWLRLPSWCTPAIAFNNTTSLPLLLVQSLESTGILSTILMSGSDSQSEAVERAKSYFLVNAMVGNSLTFALGPKLLNGQEEDAPGQPEEKTDGERRGQNGVPSIEGNEDVERGRMGTRQDGNGEGEEPQAPEQVTEQTSLLPDPVVRQGRAAQDEAHRKGKEQWDRMHPSAKSALDFLYAFVNAPVIGATLGALIGLIPALHTLFFAKPPEGGYFNAWLTASVKNVGDLFAALQVIVVGVKLSQAMRKMKKGEASGHVPWRPMLIVSFIRFALWPV